MKILIRISVCFRFFFSRLFLFFNLTNEHFPFRTLFFLCQKTLLRRPKSFHFVVTHFIGNNVLFFCFETIQKCQFTRQLVCSLIEESFFHCFYSTLPLCVCDSMSHFLVPFFSLLILLFLRLEKKLFSF